MSIATTLSAHSAPGAVPPVSSVTPLWAAVGVLSVCVVALGSSLVHVKQRNVEPLAAMAQTPSTQSLAASQAMITEKADGTPVPSATVKAQAPAAKPAAKAPAANAPVIQRNTAPANAPVLVSQAPAAEPAQSPQVVMPPPAPVVKAICAACGTVEAVTPITREGQGSGVGVVSGGVLGAVVGNQVGKGSGRAVATVLGAVGGGWAGNTIEKNMKKTTAYSVRVRMEDGSSRTIEQSSAPMVGSKVTVDGGALRPA